MTLEEEPQPDNSDGGSSPLDQGRVLQEALRVQRLGREHDEIAESQNIILTDPHPKTKGLITPERDAELRTLERRANEQRRSNK